MERYMEISHDIMSEIYNMSSCEKDYNFGMFTHNRKRLAEMIEFAEASKNSLIICNKEKSINFILIRGDSNYISKKNTLFNIEFNYNMIVPSRIKITHITKIKAN